MGWPLRQSLRLVPVALAAGLLALCSVAWHRAWQAAGRPREGGEAVIGLNAEWRDKDGFCVARGQYHHPCILRRTKSNREAVKVSLFGNSYSGFYFWTQNGLKEFLESLTAHHVTAEGLNQHELHPKLSMHTKFDSGLRHHAKDFRHIVLGEDPDYVVLQDGSLVPMGWKGTVRSDGSRLKASHDMRHTAESLESTFGPALYDWAKRRRGQGGRKPVVLLVLPWARPEEAFDRASKGHKPELSGLVDGSYGNQNYEVHRKGVTTGLDSHEFVEVHHEGEMLQATLDGISIYREHLYRGAASHAGLEDSLEFRSNCPFEVAVVPVGPAFLDLRRRVEYTPELLAAASSDLLGTWSTSYVHLSPDVLKHIPSRKERMTWVGASERNFLITDDPNAYPGFAHPSWGGMFLYASMLKRTLLALMQGKDGRLMGEVKLNFKDGHAKQRNHLIMEEVNSFDIYQFNNDWRSRAYLACQAASSVCPGDPVWPLTGGQVAEQGRPPLLPPARASPGRTSFSELPATKGADATEGRDPPLPEQLDPQWVPPPGPAPRDAVAPVPPAASQSGAATAVWLLMAAAGVLLALPFIAMSYVVSVYQIELGDFMRDVGAGPARRALEVEPLTSACAEAYRGFAVTGNSSVTVSEPRLAAAVSPEAGGGRTSPKAGGGRRATDLLSMHWIFNGHAPRMPTSPIARKPSDRDLMQVERLGKQASEHNPDMAVPWDLLKRGFLCWAAFSVLVVILLCLALLRPAQEMCSVEASDCRSSGLCCDASLHCYEKNAQWATCLPGCVEGIHYDEAEEFRSPWTCRKLDVDASERWLLDGHRLRRASNMTGNGATLGASS